jgi:histone H3/H4
VRALLEIKHFQKQTATMIPGLPMKRLIREILLDENPLMYLSKSAAIDIHIMAEDFLERLLTEAQYAAFHAKRKGINSDDLTLARHYMGVGAAPAAATYFVGKVLDPTIPAPAKQKDPYNLNGPSAMSSNETKKFELFGKNAAKLEMENARKAKAAAAKAKADAAAARPPPGGPSTAATGAG